MAPADCLFELLLQDGRRLHTGPGGSVVDWWVDSDYLTPTDTWRCSFQSRNSDDRKLLKMCPIEIRVDGRTQLFGRIDGTVKGKKGNLVELRGRDYLADLTECSVDPLVHVKPGDKLDQALLLAGRPVGIMGFEDPEIKMEMRTGAAPKKMPKLVQADMQQGKPEPGTSIFEWWNQIAARHGYTVQTASTRDKACLETPNYIQAISYEINRRDSATAGGNVVDAYADEDCSSFPTFAMMAGASGPAKGQIGRSKSAWDLADLSEAFGGDLRDSIRRWTVGGWRSPIDASGTTGLVAAQLYRLMYFRDKHAKTPAQIAEAVWRLACGQLKKSLTYSVTLKGTRDPRTGYTYAPNAMAMVDDDLADVHEPLWVSSRGMGTQEGEGTVSKLNLWRPGSFVIGEQGHGEG
jgi:prophage tail gpP-like protein